MPTCARSEGGREILHAWLWHLAGLVPVGLWLGRVSEMPIWAFLLGSYLSHSLLKIRTYLEHRAHLQAGARTVIIEDHGPLALLFLNNNFHAVHHQNPGRPWYELPALYRNGRAEFLRRNVGRMYPSDGTAFLHHFLHGKEPVEDPYFPKPSE